MDMKAFLRANWDRALAAVLVLLGVIALIIGWWGVSGTGLAAEQNPYLVSGGLLGLALIGIGCTLWLSADLQDEWRRMDAVEERLAQLASAPPPSGNDDVGDAKPAPDNGEVAPRRRVLSREARSRSVP
jgi:hypothetical protein